MYHAIKTIKYIDYVNYLSTRIIDIIVLYLNNNIIIDYVNYLSVCPYSNN